MMDLKAKNVSLASKIIAGTIEVGGAVLKWTGVFPNCSIEELSVVSFTVMGLCGTIDINLMLEKVFGKPVKPDQAA